MRGASSALRTALMALGIALLVIACEGREATTVQPTAAAAPRVAAPTDWCAEHALPESMCAKCNPSLVKTYQASGDWCAEHGFPESVCPVCNPMQAPGSAHGHAPARVGDPADWCGGHALPESMCAKCNPSLVKTYQASGDWCAEHGFPESVCPVCNPMQAPGSAHPARVGDAADWCGGHALPESMCAKCNPSLVATYQASGDWCAEHGFPESVCPVCNPMQAPGTHAPAHPAPADGQADPANWCAEHGLPESKCALCNPSVAKRFKSSGDWCAEHGQPESVCPRCNPMQPPPNVAPPSVIAAGTRIRLRTPAIERAAGIETVPATVAPMSVGVEATARIAFNRNAMADVRSTLPGIVRVVSVDLGARVIAGQPLFTLESAQVGGLQAQRQAARGRVGVARTNLARQKTLGKGAIVSRRQIELAQQELEAAGSALRAIDQSLRISGASRGARTGRFDVNAPIAGTVIRRPALVGSFAGASDALATIADPSVLWALVDVPEWDAASVRIGQSVALRVDGVPGQTFSGPVTWIAPEVDPRTRTVAARAEISNPDGVLRAGQFARATIHVAMPKGAATVPMQAVVRVGDESVVFIRTGEGIYEPRVVKLGRSDRRRVQVVGPIRAGDAVVTTGAFLLRTELSRESIGAGCCEVDAPKGD